MNPQMLPSHINALLSHMQHTLVQNDIGWRQANPLLEDCAEDESHC